LKPVALDVRHRIELLMQWSSEIRSFNERLVRTVRGWRPRGPKIRQGIAEGRSWRFAELRLLVREERARPGSVNRMTLPATRPSVAMAGSGTLPRRAASPHLAKGGALRRLPIASAVGDRRRPLGAAQLFPALEHIIAAQARGAMPLRRAAVFGARLPLTGREPQARSARRFAAATLALSRASARSQASAAVRAVRPVELAWRGNSGSAAPERNAALQLPVTVAPQDAAATDVRSRIAIGGETLPSDSRAVNRLADEVLGRIERKLRVERERRGR
jgi:hypothetical protein